MEENHWYAILSLLAKKFNAKILSQRIIVKLLGANIHKKKWQ